MHNAPAVSFPVGRSRFHVLLICFASLIGVTTLLAWVIQIEQTCVIQFAAGLFWLLSSAWAVYGWWRTPTGVLQFMGDGWHWAGLDAAQPVTIELAFDLQHTMLLLARGSQSRSCWLWLEQRLQPQRWIHLRRAIYAPRRTPEAHNKPEVPA